MEQHSTTIGLSPDCDCSVGDRGEHQDGCDHGDDSDAGPYIVYAPEPRSRPALLATFDDEEDARVYVGDVAYQYHYGVYIQRGDGECDYGDGWEEEVK